MTKPTSHKVTANRGGYGRRRILEGLGAVSLGASGALAFGRGTFAQAKAPVKLSFWTFDNPQQRPWLNKRIKLFTEKNPNVTVDFQWFPFGDLGKKISVGFATGTAPDGFVSQDWFMPTWLDKNLLAPLDVQRLGYSSLSAFSDDFAPAFVAGAVQGGNAYGFPLWFYGYCNYLNTKHFKEVGVDPEKDAPKTWEQLGEVAKRLTIKQGDKFTRQGFKFAMHAAAWTVIQFNPILIGAGGTWFDKNGKSTINNAAGVKAMTVRAFVAKNYGAEDPADTIATNPLPQLDWFKERCSMFFVHPLPPVLVKAQNPKMEEEGYYKPVQYPGFTAGKGNSSTYGFNLVINARTSKDKQEVLHDLYRFMLSDPLDCWKDTAPFTLARKSGWADNPMVKDFPHVGEIIKARDEGLPLPRTLVYNEMADALHRAVQQIMLNNADVQKSLDDAAAEIDRATAAYKKA
jgi:multiple sugar transport system substrate-binding protein